MKRNNFGLKVILTLIVLGTLGSFAGWATLAAFSGTTSNSGNTFAAGTVYISDNDADAAMYNLSNQAPGGAVSSSCIKVTYGGSLASTVKLYASSVGAFGQYVNLTITPGTGSPTFPGCTGFTADGGGAIFTGTLSAFATARTGWANGLAVNDQGGAPVWNATDAVVFKFDVSLQDNPAANGGASGALTTGSHSFTWEAQNN